MGVHVALLPDPREGGERAWFPLFVHALNHGAHWCHKPLIYICTLAMSKMDTKRYVVHEVIIVSEYSKHYERS